MNEKVFHDLTYGLFAVGSKTHDEENLCIVNTVIQIASNPTRISLACINGNVTTEYIRSSGYFTVSILDETAEFPLFEKLGMQHGDQVNKLEGLQVEHDVNNVPYLKQNACSILSCKVVSTIDLGSHTLFIAEVVDTEKLSSAKPVTYADYHSRIKPKPVKQEEKKIVGWRCTICGYVYENSTLPDDYVCPLCGHPSSDFEPIYEE